LGYQEKGKKLGVGDRDRARRWKKGSTRREAVAKDSAGDLCAAAASRALRDDFSIEHLKVKGWGKVATPLGRGWGVE